MVQKKSNSTKTNTNDKYFIPISQEVIRKKKIWMGTCSQWMLVKLVGTGIQMNKRESDFRQENKWVKRSVGGYIGGFKCGV